MFFQILVPTSPFLDFRKSNHAPDKTHDDLYTKGEWTADKNSHKWIDLRPIPDVFTPFGISAKNINRTNYFSTVCQRHSLCVKNKNKFFIDFIGIFFGKRNTSVVVHVSGKEPSTGIRTGRRKRGYYECRALFGLSKPYRIHECRPNGSRKLFRLTRGTNTHEVSSDLIPYARAIR